MNDDSVELSTNDRSSYVDRSRSPTEFADEARLIAETWNTIRICEELGATTWSVLEELEREVSEALHCSPPDLRSAREATAKALLHIDGINEL